MIQTASDSEPYKTEFTNGKVSGLSDNSPDKGGQGDGFRPHELLEAAVANCMNMSVRMYADKHGLSLDSVATTVTLNRSHDNRVCFEYGVTLEGALTQSEHDAIMNIVQTCPVRQTLSSAITFEKTG